MYSIGIDVHSASFFLSAINEQGKLVKSMSRKMSPENLIEAITSIQGPRQVVIEENHLSDFVKGVIEPHSDRLVICDPRHNRWIARDDFCDDRTASLKLAQLLRNDQLKEVKHLDADQAALRAIFLHYYDLNHQIVRCKNKIKAVFRSVGMALTGGSVYDREGRRSKMDELGCKPHLLFEVQQHYAILDKLATQKLQTCRKMVKMARREPAFNLLRTMPGAGTVIAAGYVGMIGHAHRFSRKNKIWSYAGFGNVLHTSDNRIYRSGCSNDGNRVLKWIVIQQFRHVMRTKKSNCFQEKYQHAISRGQSITAARRVTCRHILSVMRRLWIEERKFKKEGIEKKKNTANRRPNAQPAVAAINQETEKQKAKKEVRRERKKQARPLNVSANKRP